MAYFFPRSMRIASLPHIEEIPFDVLLAEQANLFYGLIGGSPARLWEERKPLLEAGVPASQVRALYPTPHAAISSRITAILRLDPELAQVLMAASSVSNVSALRGSMMRHAVEEREVPWRWQVPVPSNPLLNWARSTSMVGPSTMMRFVKTLGRLTWAFENPEKFNWREQLLLIQGLHNVFDKLAVYAPARIPAYLDAPALTFTRAWRVDQQDQEPGQTMRTFMVRPRSFRIEESDAYEEGSW